MFAWPCATLLLLLFGEVGVQELVRRGGSQRECERESMAEGYGDALGKWYYKERTGGEEG